MRIYVDFDDVICETARYFATLVGKLFGKSFDYEDIHFFNLQQSFRLTDSEYNVMMKAAHSDEELLSYEETPGASETLNRWHDEGHSVQVVTGRPFSSAAVSREWLDRHALGWLPIIHVDKYGREQPLDDHDRERALTVDEFAKLSFDFAVEDSPAGFEHLKKIPCCTVAVFNRPWNAETLLDSAQFVRCAGWKEIDAACRRRSEQA